MSDKAEIKELKKFSITISLIFIFIGVILYLNNNSLYLYFIIVPLIFILIGQFFTSRIRPVFKFWMFIALMLGSVMTRLNLGLVYYVIISPIAIISKLFGRKYLEKTFNKKDSTYWNYNVIKRDNKKRYEKQF